MDLTAVAIMAATASLALGYGAGTSRIWMLSIVALGLLWLIGRRLQRPWVGSLLFIVFIAVAALGLSLGVSPGWMLAAAVAALMAWDLEWFWWRTVRVAHVESERELIRHHMSRLLAAISVGLLLGGLSLDWRIELNFWMALLLGLLAIISLSRALRALRDVSLSD